MTNGQFTRILIMEDDPGLINLVQKRLARHGYAVDCAANGEEGLSMTKTGQYELVIVDYNMPFLGGLDVIRTLATEGNPVPVIMVTGEGNETVAVEAIKLGAADYVVKDVELRFLELLPSVIHQVLYRQQLLKERKQMEDRVRESEERYRTLFESNPHPMWVFDIETLTFLAVNDAAVRHYGYSREEFLAMSLKDVLQPEARADMTRAEAGTAADVIHAGAGKHRRKDGTIIDVESVSQPIVFGNRRARFSLITDITLRKKIEEELLKAQKLESLGILAGGIAHDFNNLLTAIIGNIALAKIDAGTGNSIREALTEAELAAVRAQALTQQLLTFSRGGAPVKKAVSINDAIREITEFALRGSKSKAHFSIPADLWSVEADEGQLSQVISNLVNNADQAMPEGGVITVVCRNIMIDREAGIPIAPGNYVMIAVEDQGVGIPKKHLEKVFDPYFTTKQKGSGLGLATSYSIIKRHNGHIQVESAEGSGSKFTFYLPAARQEQAKQKDSSPSSRKGVGKILIMDDDDMVRDVAGRILTRLGYEVEYARDGLEAITLYSRALNGGKPFNLVIMDLTIPGGMGGKEAVKQIREIDPSVKAIVSSGYSNDPIMAQYHEYGFIGVVSKPYTIKLLGDTVQKVLSSDAAPAV
jgi:PAS domain S-box-containing protein